jgi:hypothetical protein
LPRAKFIEKSGSGRGTEEDHSPSCKGGRLGGAGGQAPRRRAITIGEEGRPDKEAPRAA